MFPVLRPISAGLRTKWPDKTSYQSPSWRNPDGSVLLLGVASRKAFTIVQT